MKKCTQFLILMQFVYFLLICWQLSNQKLAHFLLMWTLWWTAMAVDCVSAALATPAVTSATSYAAFSTAGFGDPSRQTELRVQSSPGRHRCS